MIRRTHRGPDPARSRRRRETGGRRGAVALELALSLSFVIMPMLLGIWEIGCLLDAQQNLCGAVREGGRQAATGQLTNAQVQQVVLQYLAAAGVKTAGVTVTVTNTGSGVDASVAAQLDPLVVTAKLPFANVDWSATNRFVSASTVLTSTTTWYSAKDVPYAAPPAAPTQ